MPPRLTKEQTERRVFGEFAKKCPLDFAGRAIPQKPPAPDLLCKLRGGEQLAFELTQVDDPQYLRLCREAENLNDLLADAREKLNNREAFRGCIVRVNFNNDTKYGERKKYLPQVVDILNANGISEKEHAIRDKKNRLVGRVEVTNLHLSGDVYIATSTASHVGDYTLELIKKKFFKRYASEHPIHLLAWAQSVWLPEVWASELASVFKEQDNFARLWVYHWEHSIIFDSETYRPTA